jgi:hypothetical protein
LLLHFGITFSALNLLYSAIIIIIAVIADCVPLPEGKPKEKMSTIFIILSAVPKKHLNSITVVLISVINFGKSIH